MESILLFILSMIINSDVFISHVLSNLGNFTNNGQPNITGALIQSLILVMIFAVSKTFILN